MSNITVADRVAVRGASATTSEMGCLSAVSRSASAGLVGVERGRRHAEPGRGVLCSWASVDHRALPASPSCVATRDKRGMMPGAGPRASHPPKAAASVRMRRGCFVMRVFVHVRPVRDEWESEAFDCV
jgi:hypothetical protein